MEIQASRLRARVGPSGDAVLLADQNRRLWDRLLIGGGMAALERAARLPKAELALWNAPQRRPRPLDPRKR